MERYELGESKNTEFKREIPKEHDKFLKDIVAFANTLGGKSIVGIEDKSLEVVGIGEESPFKLADSITNMIADACTPLIDTDIYSKTLQGKTVLVIDVFPGKQRPYYLKNKGREKGTYIRINGTSRQADELKIRELLIEGENRSYDTIMEVGGEFDEETAMALCDKMREIALKNCITDAEKSSVHDMNIGKLEDMGILCRRSGKLFPTHAFNLMTKPKTGQASIQCAHFKGLDRSLFISKKEFAGPIYEQLEKAFEFFMDHTNIGAVIDGLYRKDIYEFPPDAVREVLANALMHRSYIDESKIQMSIFDDRLEIVSPGLPFGGLDIESMKLGRSSCRNKAIAEAFKYMRIVEAWGTGIPRIIKAFDEYVLQEPVFEEFGNCVKVIMYRPGNDVEEIYAKRKFRNFGEKGNNEKKSYSQTSERSKDIIRENLSKNYEMSTAQLAEILSLSKSRVRAILLSMDEVQAVGRTNMRKYRLKK